MTRLPIPAHATGSRSGAAVRAAVLAMVLASLSCGAVRAGPITTHTALPIHEGEVIVRGQVEIVRATDDPSGANRSMTVWAFPMVVAWGVDRDLALFGMFPYLDKRLGIDTPGGRRTRGDSGLGDVTCFARYTVGQWDFPGETLRLAPFAGLKAPTGAHTASDALGRLPHPLQLGSGSWDPLAGAVFTWQTLDHELDISASRAFKSPADGFTFGDETRLDVSWQQRLVPRKLEGGGVPDYVYGVLETNLVWADRNRVGPAADPNSGGFTWYVAPGIQYVTKRWVVEAAVQIPVVQGLNGSALRRGVMVTGGFRASF